MHSGDAVFEGVADPLAAGEWAAFHGRPGSGITGLEHALEDRSAARFELAKARWLLGVCLGASGRLGDAFAVLEPIAGAPGRGDRWASFAASTAGALHRRLGRHTVAAGYDGRALEAAEALPPGDIEPGVDARVGLAAGAAAEGDLVRARAFLADAEAVAGSPDVQWRPRVRTAVAAGEIALLEGRPSAALAAAERAVAGAEAGRAPRHVARSQLLRGIALHASDDLPRAAEALRASLARATELEVPPLIWPAGAALGELLGIRPDLQRYLDEAERAADAARRAVARIASGLPDELADEWLRRPGVPGPYDGTFPIA